MVYAGLYVTCGLPRKGCACLSTAVDAGSVWESVDRVLQTIDLSDFTGPTSNELQNRSPNCPAGAIPGGQTCIILVSDNRKPLSVQQQFPRRLRSACLSITAAIMPCLLLHLKCHVCGNQREPWT